MVLGTPTPISPDFPNLSNVWKTLNPTGVKAADYSPTNTPVACPEFTSAVWEVNPTSALPTLGQEHTFGAQATSSGGSPSSTRSGSAQASSSSSPGAAPESLGRKLKGVGVALTGLMAMIAWL